MKKLIIPGVLAFSLIGCNLAPKYERPAMLLPEHFKEAGTWLKVAGTPHIVAPDAWWEAFHDPILNDLERKLTAANQDLRVAFAHYQDAYALAQVARSYYFPTIQGLFNADRQQTSHTVANPPKVFNYNQILVGGYLSYEVDAWGSVRNAVVNADNLAKASAADVAAIHLSLHAELANDYFYLRGSDEQQRILDKTVRAYYKALYLTKQRYKGGVAPIADVDEAQTQLENAKTQAEDMRLQRAQLEHAIAVLVGEVPSNFSMASGKLPSRFLAIEPNLPSTLVQRRPDIIAAERRVIAANANIGVARAAFFPQFTFTSTGGFQSKTFSNLFSKPSLFWSLGPLSLLTLVQPVAEVTIFDGGRLRSLLNQAKADYYGVVASYRQAVLTAFQEVEDNLIALKQLDKERVTQEAATRAAIRAWQQEIHRYRGGLVTFLQVVIVENAALQSELASVMVRTRRQMASIQLIKALGGGWSVALNRAQKMHRK
ncbi:MAG: efflux transporter outer membrane subunit [Legionella sp.]|uniref:efflux transporter outer membrane subunit n=1 Tax=Legionella sp. TaxID=459 RepID=UPI0039E5359C